jgi:hypothetical protein
MGKLNKADPNPVATGCVGCVAFLFLMFLGVLFLGFVGSMVKGR